MRKLTSFSMILMAAVLILVQGVVAQDTTVITHVVQRGENLFRIAQQYNTTVTQLAQLNAIANTWQIFPGQALLIPVDPATAMSSEPAAAPAAAAPVPSALELPAATTTHVVTRGEHLTSIAQQYGMTPEQLASLNGITNPNLIYAGQTLIVNAPAGAPAAVEVAAPVAAAPDPLAAAPVTYGTEIRHVVQPGEYLASIGAQYGVSWLAIAQANGIYDPNTVFAGMELIIPGTSGYSPEAVYVPAAPAAVIPTGHSIVVDLSDQRVYAYEDGVLVRNVLVSTGLPGSPTVLGDYAVERKYIAQTMTGPGYYLPDVPYVMYFYSGYALHGTYWHSNFGTPMSHGCVNLPTPEAEWFYSWADYGTPVHVQA